MKALLKSLLAAAVAVSVTAGAVSAAFLYLRPRKWLAIDVQSGALLEWV